MVQNEDPTHTHLLDFNATWHSACGHDCLLVYSTGRSPHLYRELWVGTWCYWVLVFVLVLFAYWGMPRCPYHNGAAYVQTGWECSSGLAAQFSRPCRCARYPQREQARVW